MDVNAIYTALAVCSAVSLLLVGLAIPLVLGKVVRNPWYGFRTPKTLSDDAIWYPVNREAAKGFIYAGGFILMVAIILFGAKNSMTPQTVVLTMATVTIVLILWAVIRSFIFLSRFTPKN